MFRRTEIPWEVVDSKGVKPVLWDADADDDDIDIASVSDADTCGTYVFQLPRIDDVAELRNAVVFARQQLLQSIQKRDFNALLSESWNLTILRRGKRHRVQVEYTGRPARLVGKLPALRPPPFIQILQH